jgi:hypothetical protein
MNKFVNVNICRRRFLRLGIAASVATSIQSGLRASKDGSANSQYFNVPEGKAAKTLRLAVKQAHAEILLSAEIVKGVRTRAIKGSFTPIEAFNRMLSGTRLEVFLHKESGAYTVRRVGDPEKEPHAAFPHSEVDILEKHV